MSIHAQKGCLIKVGFFGIANKLLLCYGPIVKLTVLELNVDTNKLRMFVWRCHIRLVVQYLALSCGLEVPGSEKIGSPGAPITSVPGRCALLPNGRKLEGAPNIS